MAKSKKRKRNKNKNKNKKKIRTSEELQLLYSNLQQRVNNVLLRIVEKHWISCFHFTTSDPFKMLDGMGIDLVWNFESNENNKNGNNKIGWAFAQQKTQKKDVAHHFKVYPVVPLYLLSVRDDEDQIEFVLLTLFLQCRAYDLNKEREIQRRHKVLRNMLKKIKKNKLRTKRVWLNWKSRKVYS